MIRLATDQNFDNTILRGLWHRRPSLDIVRVQDVGLSTAEDPEVLAWAVSEQRVLLTHDAKTMPRQAYDRVDQGLAMPGVLLIRSSLMVGLAIDAILQVVEANVEGALEGQVRWLQR